MRRWLQRKLINFLVKRLFGFLDQREILREEKGQIFLGYKPLTVEQTTALREDAQKFLEESSLYAILWNAVRHAAYALMFERSARKDDILAGKMMLYNLEIIDKKLREIARL